MEHCTACGADARVIEGSYAYVESGLENVTLEGIDLIHCDTCGNEDPVIPGMNALRSLIAEALISKPARLSGKEIRFLRKFLELTARDMSRIIHVDTTTLSKWENDADQIGTQSDLVFRALIAAKKEDNFAEVVQKLEALDSNRSALDIIINTQTHEIQYA